MGIVLHVAEGAARGGVIGMSVSAVAGYLLGTPMSELSEGALAGAVGGAFGGALMHAIQEQQIQDAAVAAARAHA